MAMKGKFKINISKADIGKAAVILIVALFQGALGVMASYVTCNGTAFDAHNWNMRANYWNQGCWNHISNSFFIQIAWFPQAMTTEGVWGPFTTSQVGGGCIQSRTQVMQASAWCLHFVFFWFCVLVVQAGLTGSKKKCALYAGLTLPVVGCVMMVIPLLLSFIVSNNCMSGGFFYRWQSWSFQQQSGGTQRVGKDTDSPYKDYTWLDAGYFSMENPECWWGPTGLNVWFALGPFILAMYSGVSMYLPEKKYKDFVKYVGPYIFYLVGLCCYGVFMPRLYMDADTDEDDRVIYRVVAHPAFMEVMAFPFRSFGKQLSSVSLRVAYLFFPVKTTTLYSRFLVNTVTDETLIIVSSISLGFVEILMRTTVHQRDKLGQILTAKLTGRKFTNFDRAFLMEYKCSLVVLEMVFELADILTMCGFFSFLCQAGGPLRDAVSLDTGNPVFAKAGFKIEKYFIKNTWIQVLIEVAVGMACLTLEISLGFPVLQIVRKGYFVPFFICSSSFGFVYTAFFLMSLFIFPILDFQDVIYTGREDEVFVITNSFYSPQNYWDLYNTWCFFIPATVETSFVILWQKEAFG